MALALLAPACVNAPVRSVRPQPNVASLTVQTVPGAEVHVDGAHVGTAPLAQPVEVSPGPHHVAATLGGHQSRAMEVALEGGRPRKIVLDLDETSQRKGAWAAIGVGGASVAVGIVFGALSVVEHRAAQDLEDGPQDSLAEENQEAFETAIERRDDYRMVSGVMGGIGLALFVSGAFLYAFDEPSVPKPPRGPRRASHEVRLSIVPWGAFVIGRYE